MKLESRFRGARSGFSLVEVTVVVVILGVLAAFGVPRMLKSVERSKAAEAFEYLSAVRSSQESYQSRQGTYAGDTADLDVTLSAPKYFTVGSITAGEDTWTLTLTREGAASGYGDYTVTFTQEGYDSANSTIEGLPEINPRGT